MSNRTQRRAEQRRAAKLARKTATAETGAPISTSEKPQASEAQIAANRENATHSTGPRSESGRAAVSQNRRVHGLNYTAATFTVLPCEDQSDYDRLVQSLIDEHKPDTPTESLLVATMAQHRWLFDRASRLQETCLDPQTGQISNEKQFSLYLRYATTHERAFHKCLNDLLSLRKIKQKLEIGFESEKRQQDRHKFFLDMEDLEKAHRCCQVHGAEIELRRAERAEQKELQLQTAA